VKAAHPSAAALRPGRWSNTALALSTTGMASATWIVLGGEGDSADVRRWLVAVSVALCALSVLVPLRAVRTGAVAALAGWCVLAAASIGFSQVPAFARLLGARFRADA